MRIAWIDLLRGFCMMAILWFHTEMYYAGRDVVPYALYVGDVLAAFFFISGYLLYSQKPFNAAKKLRSILRHLLIPYFVFTAIIAWPKAIAHGSAAHHGTMALHIITGQASWFVAALIVAQTLFILTLWLSRKSIPLMALIALLSLMAAILTGNTLSPYHNQHNLWHINEALLAYPLLFAGYLYHRREDRLSPLLTPLSTIGILLLLLIAIKIIAFHHQAQMIFSPIVVTHPALFLADLLLSVLFLVALFQRLPANKTIQWTGAHSLIYYFFCGGVPFVVAALFRRLGIPYTPVSFLPAFLLVYILTSLIAWFVYRFTPIMKKD